MVKLRNRTIPDLPSFMSLKNSEVKDFKEIEKKMEAANSVNRVTPYLNCLPPFSGEGDSIKEFFAKLGDVAQYAAWEDSDYLFAISMTLKGRALVYFNENIRARGLKTYQEIRDALITRFEEKELFHEPTRRLLQAYQRPQETVREFASRIEALSFKTVPKSLRGKVEGEESRLELLRGVFLEGLKPKLMHLVMHQNPKTYEEALSVARLEEELYVEPPEGAEVRVAGNSSKNNSTPSYKNNPMVTQPASIDPLTKLVEKQQSTLAQLTKMFGTLQTQVQDLSTNTAPVREPSYANNNQRSSKQRRCFRCGKIGHFQSECRSGPQYSMPYYHSGPAPPPFQNPDYGPGGVFQHNRNNWNRPPQGN